MNRDVLLVLHTGRQYNLGTAEKVAGRLIGAGMRVRVLAEEAPQLSPTCYSRVVAPGPLAAEGTELVLVLGGDGTLLRASELARMAGVPVFGVNLGRVGFLAGADFDALDEAVDAVVEGRYHVDERMTIDVTARLGNQVLATTWALNEASVEKSSRERILDVVVEVDGHPVSTFGCDGVLCSTPTGSTAYAFSAGGPVVWPEVEALLVVPSNAHALFARPLVLARDSVLALEVDHNGHDAVLCCDGQRHFDLPAGARVEVLASEKPLRLVRLHDTSFTDRLVRKFELPVHGWRGPVSE
ncbi:MULTISPECIES: NAD kinase [Actinopolyspora]|uniref:NAD kinase n=1 Tax=Actinopolyspora saharensis TaxID=995062 RepID=A0A1H1A1I1_9ACTN|nr:NAD kinase [Actinopolyspora saharensis]NHD15458.1 NAD kinase [Actinopolyspora sp. BKK2]NHE75328.1 NAD kinase [Actinopolyspora sp. BKK1]SDQ33509.1 NAD+ kinase [Actinopolyspora saharensis]